MRVVFFGSPEFAVPTFEALLGSRHEVVAVVTRPPRARGRGRRPAPTAVARRAEAAGIEVLTPERPRDPALVTRLRAFAPDVLVVAAYGRILPPELLDLARHGAINVHASLLPDLRGAAPVTRAILEGRSETGVSIMQMDEGLDEGPVLLRASTPIADDDTAGSLTERLAALGAGLLVAALDRLELGPQEAEPQDHAAATYAHKITTEEARLDWSRPAVELARAVRAFDPWPGAWTTWRGERLEVARLATVEGDGSEAPPGTILTVEPAPLVQTGDRVVRLVEVQPAGGRRMSGEAWARGRRVAPGERLES